MASTPFYFDEATHRYTRSADGLVVPSATQVLTRVGLASYDQIKADVLERASVRGTAVHQITEFLDTEFAGVPESEIDLTPVSPEYLPYVQAWLKFKRECDVRIIGVEQQFLADLNGMPFGMKYDVLGEVNGRAAVLEKKTCSSESSHWGIQLAAYDLGVGQCPTQLRRDRYAVQLRKDGNYRLWPYKDEGDYNAFSWALALCWWQLNHGYKFD